MDLKLFVKTGFTNLSDENLEKEGIKKWMALESNTNFPAMVPTAAVISALIKAATENFHNARNAVPFDAAFKNEKGDALIVAMNNGAMHIQLNHGNVLSVLLSSGYVEKDTQGTPVGPLPVVENMKQRTPYDAPAGTMLVMWDGVEHANGYLLEYTQDQSPMAKPTIKFVSPTEYLITNLIPGQQLFSRVAAAGTDPSLSFCEIKGKFVQ